MVLHPGLAHLCILKDKIMVTKARVDVTIPKKRGAMGAANCAKTTEKFLQRVKAAVFGHGESLFLNTLRIHCQEYLFGHQGWIAARAAYCPTKEN